MNGLLVRRENFRLSGKVELNRNKYLLLCVIKILCLIIVLNSSSSKWAFLLFKSFVKNEGGINLYCNLILYIIVLVQFSFHQATFTQKSCVCENCCHPENYTKDIINQKRLKRLHKGKTNKKLSIRQVIACIRILSFPETKLLLIFLRAHC